MFSKSKSKSKKDTADSTGAEHHDRQPATASANGAQGSREEVGFEHREDYTAGPKRSPFFVLRRTVREFLDDGGTDLAAALTYFSVLSLFPGLIALLSLVGVFGQAGASVEKILEILSPLVSSETIDRLRPILTGLATMEGAGLTLVVGVLGALWSASAYVGAFSRAMNRIYEVEEGRPFWRLRPMQIAVTVLTVVLCAAALLILIVTGPVAEAVGNAIGVGSDLVVLWGWLKWPVLALIVMVVVAVLYSATPNVKFPKFRVISAGAFVAILVWLVASVGFAVYVANFSSYNRTYGSVAVVIIGLLWLWITNLALLFGAELDAELERGRQLQVGIAAEETLQLPVRDTRIIEKARARRAEDHAKQRAIRLAAAGPGDPADRPFGRR